MSGRIDRAISRNGRRLLLALGLSLALTGLARADDVGHDPYEAFNRPMFAVHETIDGYLTRPVARVYDKVVPMPVEAGIGNFFGNLGDLWIGVNSALQGKAGDAGSDFARLLINSTIGIFGLFDVASELGFEKHDEDFGQTLAVWGVGDGGFLFFPVIGPRTLRDTASWAIDLSVDPVGWVDPVSVRNSLVGTRLIDTRAALLPADKVFEEAALDKYAYVRDAYLQRRRSQIYDGRPPRLDDDY